MFPQKRQINAEVDPKTYPLGEQIERSLDGPALALVALDHTPVERRLYSAMLRALETPTPSLTDSDLKTPSASEIFTVRRVMQLADISNLSTARRGLEGLVSKSSAERVPMPSRKANSNGDGNGDGNGSNGNVNALSANGRGHGVCYRVRMPDDVIAARDEIGTNTFRQGITSSGNHAFERVIHRILATKSLSRREAQVALCCAEGLTNAEIGSRLRVKEQTVKFHLRHVFLKFGVKRRAELISRLLL